MLCVGIDSGTTACKALILDAESGKVLASAGAPQPFVEGLPHGHVEQEPRTWIKVAESVLGACLEKLGERRREIVAICVSAQQHGLVVFGDKNQQLRAVNLWCDIC